MSRSDAPDRLASARKFVTRNSAVPLGPRGMFKPGENGLIGSEKLGIGEQRASATRIDS